MAADVGARCERRARRDYGGCESASLPLRVCARVCAPVCASQPASQPPSVSVCECAFVRAPPCGPLGRPLGAGARCAPRFPGGGVRAAAPGPPRGGCARPCALLRACARVRGAPPGSGGRARVTAAPHRSRPRNVVFCVRGVVSGLGSQRWGQLRPGVRETRGREARETGLAGRAGVKPALDLLPLVISSKA